ncbi:hypothetical protein ACFQ07_04320, partial [Actinomadura adrarensis]
MADHEPDSDPRDGLVDAGVVPVGRFEWERVIRRCRLGFYEGRTKDPRRWVRNATVQQVALMLATYADMDGTRIRPRLETVAAVCEIDVRTVRISVARLRWLNLLEQ